ncbi:MAG: hypothetical protein GX267_08250 [Fibrobacter sp.]|jgi:hypothetical protein|nr:hypothetical protein [Fibrobacter sp.]
MYAKAIGMLILLSVCLVNADIVIDLSGIISNRKGETLSNAIVTLEKSMIATESNSDGKYSLNKIVGVKPTVSSVQMPSFLLKNGLLTIKHNRAGKWGIRAFDLNGKMIWDKSGNIIDENLQIKLLQVPSVTLYVLSLGQSEFIIRANTVNGIYSVLPNYSSTTGLTASASSSSNDTIRVSKAGYVTTRLPVNNLSGTLNIVLDTLVNDSVGKSSLVDGSMDRLTRYGEAQYFWGTLGDVEQPLVKIVHAVSNDVVDIEVIFSPYFVDNTYGTNAIGWGKRGHTFADLYESDHVALSISNADGDIVFEGKLDLISQTKKTQSGYACLGPFGGEGKLSKGNPSDIVSFGNSLDDNLNYFGYNLQTNSPATDSTYKVNPQYPYWQYYVVYRLSIKASAFGESGYGKALMSSVHASPSKDKKNTITVIEKDPPVPNTPLDVFRYILPPVIKPPVNNDIDVD